MSNYNFLSDNLFPIINSITANLVTAVIIFAFVYFNRKKPKLIATGEYSASLIGLCDLEQPDLIYMVQLEIKILNDSIYKVHNLKVLKTISLLPNPYLSLSSSTIDPDGTVIYKVILQIEKKREEVVKSANAEQDNQKFYTQLRSKYLGNAVLHVQYRNDDNRLITKKLNVNIKPMNG